MTTIIGHRKGMVHGPHLYGAAGQIIYSTASGATAQLAAPTIANQPLVASAGLIPSWGHPRASTVVAADVTHTQSNTTLSDITGLLVPIGASATEIWFFDAFLLLATTSTAVDLKIGWGTMPTSATMKWGALATIAGNGGSFSTTVGTGGTPVAIETQSSTITTGSANLNWGLSYAGMIYGGGTAGNVQMQFAQNTSTAVDLTVQKGSMLRYQRLVA